MTKKDKENQASKNQYSEVFNMTVPLPITDARKIEVGNLLAQDETELNALITMNKAANAEFRKEKKGITDTIGQRVEVLTSGVEQTTMPCRYLYNFPTKGEKTLYAQKDIDLPGDNTTDVRVDISIRVEDMTEDEKLDLFKN